MTRSLTSPRGMSLVEATIILFVLMLLTSVLAPSMGDFINDAKMVKVKEDCEAIGISVMRMVRDVGPCFRTSAGGACVDAIYSQGRSGDGDWPASGGNMEEQFVTNQHAGLQMYAVPGWRGAYLSPSIGPDPWGTRYGVNTRYLVRHDGAPGSATSGSQAAAAGDTGSPEQCNDFTNGDVDVICIAAGPNQRYDSAFGGNQTGGTSRQGDDFIYVIQNSQRAFIY